jgi:hypothetical protein
VTSHLIPDRSWLRTFVDPDALRALLRAAKTCMAEADDCEPEDCPHRVNLMTPLEFAEWVEREVHRDAERSWLRELERRDAIRVSHLRRRDEVGLRALG